MVVFEDCTICLDPMQEADLQHPLQCPCGYNFCMRCMASLIQSSKDDYGMASDGNRHVKVFLRCPLCRSDLSESIRETLLLRKADSVVGIQQEELTPAQILLKEAMNKPEVKEAIKKARRLEAEYFGKDTEADEEEEKKEDEEEEDEEYDDFVEEEGIEADLFSGVHESFRFNRIPSLTSKASLPQVVDPSLFMGMDSFLTDEDDRIYLTELMTSGEPQNVAQAAEFLQSTLESQTNPSKTALPKRNPKTFARRSSVFELIAEADHAHRQRFKLPETNRARNLRRHHELEEELSKQVQFQKLFPLPVRMPKCIKLDLRKPFEMEFADYKWNGTVMDAYSKIDIGFTGAISQRQTNNPAVWEALGTDSDVRIALEQPRVLVKKAGYDAGHQGAVTGDVVSHVNGKSVLGLSSGQVLVAIHKAKGECKGPVSIVLNAERSVAEALKRRSMAIAEKHNGVLSE